MVSTEQANLVKPNVGIQTVLHHFMMKYEQRREYQGFKKVSGPRIEDIRRNHEVNDSDQSEDNQDSMLCSFISSSVIDCLRIARDKELSSNRVFIPCGLADKAAADIILMSKDEPCGVRGCALELVMDDGNLCKRIGKVEIDPNTVTTFEITLVLTKDSPRWLVSKLQSYLRNSYEPATTVKQGYKLIKRKLYRSESKVAIREVTL